jgi:adenylate cyclase
MRRRAPALVLAAVLAVALAVSLDEAGTLDRVEEQAVDARFDVRGGAGRPDGVVVVGVDSTTLDELDMRWPFPRADQARLVDAVRRAGARLLAYDLQVEGPGESEEGDVALFDAFERSRPYVQGTSEPGRPQEILGADAAGGVLAAAVVPLGADGVVREVSGSIDAMEQFAVATVRVATGRRVLAPDERTWIDWAGKTGTVRTLSWSRVLRGEEDAAIRDKIVVVGLTAPALRDKLPVAVGDDVMPGPEIQANAIATLLRGTPLESAPAWVNTVLVVLAALLVPLLAIPLSLKALFAGPAALAALLGGAQLAFNSGVVVAVAAPAIALALGAVAAAIALLLTEVRDRRRLRATFARFVPEDVVNRVADRADPSEGLPGEELDATVVFNDLRGFTTYAEGRPASEVIATLNRYLGEMTAAVHAHGGTVVAYLGDGMMSVFGAPVAQPDHADRALAAARDMAGPRLDALNGALGTTFRLGVGLHAGPVMSGTVGSRERMEYAAVGDTTNCAARIQALTKDHGVAILLTGAVHDRLTTPDGMRELGVTTVRGRAAPLALWADGAAPAREPATA